MKKVIMTISALFVMAGFQAQAATQQQPQPQREVTIGLNGAHVPAGFDSSADAYVIVNGVFQNGCYKWKRADIKNTGDFTHEVESIASVSQGMCLMVLVPFQKEVRLGKLAKGEHTFKFVSGDGTFFEKKMVIQ